VTPRGSAPVVGVVVLLAVGIALGGVVAAGAETVATATGTDLGESTPSEAESIAVSLELDGDTIAVTHEAGPDLRVSRVRLVVAVGGTPLDHQPPVPFFAAQGFRAGPTGPFNVASDGVWAAGETGSVRVASTNSPDLEAGRTVSVAVYVNDEQVAEVRGTVE
jgi:hypothetical protein